MKFLKIIQVISLIFYKIKYNFFFRATDFIITASCDGNIKFWKKQDEGIEFVKHFRAHLGNIQSLAANVSGTRLASISNDKSLKIFDVENFGKNWVYFC